MENCKMWQEKYRVLQDDVILEVIFNPKTRKQFIKLQKWDTSTNTVELEEKHRCTRPIIYSDDHSKTKKHTLDGEFEPLKLTIEDQWFALISWASGIQNLGMNTFTIMKDIEAVIESGWSPLSSFFLQFMVKVDISYLQKMFDYIESSCRFQGEIHYPSLYANFNILLYIIQHQSAASEKVIEFIYSYDKKFLFTHPDYEERQEVARSIFGPNYSEYALFFEDRETKDLAAANPYAVKVPGYEKFIHDPSVHVRLSTAKNPEAKQLKGFNRLLNDENPRVREAAKENLSLN